MATSHANILTHVAAQSQHQQPFASSLARPADPSPVVSASNLTQFSKHTQNRHASTGHFAEPHHIPPTRSLGASKPTPSPTTPPIANQLNTQPSSASHHLQSPKTLDDLIWAFVWQVIYSKIDSVNRNPGPSEPTTDMQVAMAIKKELHLYSPWESMILQKAIDVMLTPIEEGEEEEESEATSLSTGGFAHDSEATRDTSPDPILEHMQRVSMRKRKEHPSHEAEDRCRHRPRRRRGSVSSAASEKSDIQSYFMKERDRREGMEYFLFFGELKDPTKLQEVLCAQTKPILYPVSASNFKVEIRNGIHQLIRTPNRTDVVNLMIGEVTGWEAKTRLGDYTQSKEMGELCVIDTPYALRLLRGEKR